MGATAAVATTVMEQGDGELCGCGERAREGGGLREGRERGRSSLGGRTKARRVT